GVFADAGEVHEGNGHEGEGYLNSVKKQKAGAKPASYNFLFPEALVNRVFCARNPLQNETLRTDSSAARITGSGRVQGVLVRRPCAQDRLRGCGAGIFRETCASSCAAGKRVVEKLFAFALVISQCGAVSEALSARRHYARPGNGSYHFENISA